jgi:hypothetical protein
MISFGGRVIYVVEVVLKKAPLSVAIVSQLVVSELSPLTASFPFRE